MPQITQVRPSRKKPVGIAVGVVVAAVVVAGVLVWLGRPNVAKTVAAADALNLTGKYSEAYSKVKGVQPWALTKSDKVLVLSRLAGTAQSLGHKDEALKHYQDLNKLEPHQPATLTALAQLATDQGQKDVALVAYKEALQLEESAPKKELTDSNIEVLKYQISQLEQK